MFLLFVFSAVVATVTACGGGTGDLKKQVTMTSTVSPPVEWIPVVNASDQDIAEKQIIGDIKDAVKGALDANKIDYSQNPPVIALGQKPPLALTVSEDCVATTNCLETDLNLRKFSGRVYYTCHWTNGNCAQAAPVTTFKLENEVTITLGQAIYESQWNQLAVLIQDQLETEKKVVFWQSLKLKN